MNIKIRLLTVIYLMILSVGNIVAQNRTIKIACAGNSITYGALIPNREYNSYPAQLQMYLGDKYEVKNFGVSGSTLLTKGDHPYIKTDKFAELCDYQPDIILIKLGTNDTKPQNWIYKDEYISDYTNLIERLRGLKSNPRIILLTPVRCYLEEGEEIDAKTIENEVRPMVEQISFSNNTEIINLFNIYGNEWKSHIMPDKLHPSSIGANYIAKKIASYLTYDQAHNSTEIQKGLGITNSGTFNFHGYKGFNFTVDSVQCKIVMPNVETDGQPWILRARFWGHEPQTDIDMLEHGFYIAYCDVSNLLGGPEAISRWDRFYDKMTDAGLSDKVILEGMSRGGLIVYNWASRHPERVACIYADAPVMDYRSWPLGYGKSEKECEITEHLLKAYSFTDENQALQNGNKIIDSHAKIMSASGIPILHVVGDADSIVPLSENTAVFEQKMMELNTPITVIHKPSVGHHPHSLADPTPIVNFMLDATGRLKNECTQPVPGCEYRPGAGWNEGNEWHSVAEDIRQSLTGRKLKLLLLGNSITQGWGGERKAVSYKPGKKIMDEMIGQHNWETAGISGDKTQNLLWRIINHDYNVCNPSNVVIAIGINNLISGYDDPKDVAEGILTVARVSRQQFPGSRIILLGLLPSGKDKQCDIRSKYDQIHSILKKTKLDGVDYIDPTDWFLNSDGSIDDNLYTSDYIHLTENGYKKFASELKKIIL